MNERGKYLGRKMFGESFFLIGILFLFLFFPMIAEETVRLSSDVVCYLRKKEKDKKEWKRKEEIVRKVTKRKDEEREGRLKIIGMKERER